jgi:uncharacterized protein
MQIYRLALVFLVFLPVFAQEKLADYIKANYTKYEYRIAMRDGAKLFTSVYMPKDARKPYPMIMVRTPYSVSPYGVDQYKTSLGPSEKFDREGFIFVFQDVRGRYMSEGEYVHVRPHIAYKNGPRDVDESSDTYDTIDWLVKNLPNNNGRVGIWGISYPGFYAAASLPDAHPALKAVSPQAPVTDWFIGDDFHHNGAFFLAHAFRFFINFDRIRPEPEKKVKRPNFEYDTPNGYEFFKQFGNAADVAVKFDERQLPFYRQMMEHPNYDQFWQSRLILPHLTNVTPAVMAVGGWFDAEDVWGPVNVYKSVEKQSPGATNTVVYGPWRHGGWSRSDGDHLGDVQFNAKTGEYYRENIIYPFFNYHLKQEGELDLPEAFMFETGTNEWRRFDEWPPAGETKKLYFHAAGKLSHDAPTGADGFDAYTSDPNKPVPHVGYTTQHMPVEYMLDDQRFAASRPDVLVYETEPLDEDVTIGGAFTASLKVSVTGTGADFIVKLIDVYPPDFPNPDPNPKGIKMGTYQQLVRGEPIRGRYRNSFEKPEPFQPGEVTTVEFELPDILHTFRREHKIMVQVQSTWFPLVDRNPQKYVDIYHAKPEDFQKAEHRVHRSAEHTSYVELTELR